MKKTAILLAGALLVSCAGTPEISEYDQVIEDYVSVSELEAMDSIRTQDRDSFTRLTDHYVIYETRNADFLLYFGRPCREIGNMSRVTPDYRRDDRLRKGFDTLRGCRIDGIYATSDAQSEELANMGDGR